MLGSGRVDQKPYYFYYEPVGYGGYKLSQVPADESVIYEDAAESTGSIVELRPTFGSLIWSLRYPNAYEIHIPKGSIVREFSPNVGR